MPFTKRPESGGLYDPLMEKENCGVGFVAHIKGKASHSIIENAGTILVRMSHRGACGCEPNTGDGAGILTALPSKFLRKIARDELGLSLPGPGRYSAGLVFLPRNDGDRDFCMKRFEETAADQRQTVLGWRKVPVDNSSLGPTARAAEPDIYQVFIGAGLDTGTDAFERELYVIRKRVTAELRAGSHDVDHMFYVASLSTRIIVYKGMLTPEQLFGYFRDLSDPDFESHLAMIHSRFSTNTFPSWDRAQPLRFMSHNGEINTLRGNINKMRAREGTLESDLFGGELKKVFPVIEPDLSDSGNFDNVLELLLLTGRSLPEAIMMMIPEAWENHPSMSDSKRDFYEYHSCLMEPWDGPASIAFSDGTYIGAVLDRNGLRPSRFYITEDDLVVMASEVGVLDLPPERIRFKGRLQPGKMFFVDFAEGRIIDDDEIKETIASKRPYGKWLSEQRIRLADLGMKHQPHGFYPDTLIPRLRMAGYSLEHLELILQPMATDGKEPLGSMGNDTPLAVLSGRPRMLYDYFKQLFAQVTNPPIDSIREEIIMSLESYIGPERNLLAATPEHCGRLHLPMPVLTNEELAALKHMDYRGWKTKMIDMTFAVQSGEEGMTGCLDFICEETEKAISQGYGLVILSDRAAGRERIPLSPLMAVGAVHQHLIRKGRRMSIGIVLETGEPREVHHFCMLLGYGADAINPYLAYEAMWQLKREGKIPESYGDDEITANYLSSLSKGMRKVFGKMGISTLASYKGAQIFEAVGLDAGVMDRCFAGTPSRISGAGFSALYEESRKRHELAFPDGNIPVGYDAWNPGEYKYRFQGEKHMWDPESVADIQVAARTNDPVVFQRFLDRQNQRSAEQATLRGLLKFRPGTPVPLEEVESARDIVKRFVTGAMSFGSISQEAHETLAVAMNRLGGKSNTGEGGEDSARFLPLPNGDSKRSAIKQVASGRFGVTIEYLTNADELQIKMAQGAKPGEGGELPGHKVLPWIARTRHSTPGVGLISPPPHHDIYSIEDLSQLIFDLKNANPAARISVKLVSEVGVGTVAAGVVKAKADHILISGHDGGTGASPLTGIKHAGLPWELGLAETHQTLVLNDLRNRVVLQTDGHIKTGRDVVIAAMLGAEECGFATTALVTLGCVMMRKCEKNTCPVGIATQDPVLRRLFAGKPEYVVNYFMMLAEDIRKLMAALGFRKFTDMVGRVDMLDTDAAVRHWKSEGIDLSPLLQPARKPSPDTGVYCTIEQDHGIDDVLDRRLIPGVLEAVDDGRRIGLSIPVRNTDRAVGTMLSHEIAKRFGDRGLPEGSVHVKLTGTAGQSFGAWLAHGVTLELEGDANDYVGKGLSGGRLVVYPPAASRFVPENNIIIGNVALYGAIRGEAFFRGMAAERFCVRNSGARVVVEGVGDHGCEYMTGGRVVVLGETGRNFAAGMSGGIAYVWNRAGDFISRVNPDMVSIGELSDEDDDPEILELIRLHAELTGSTVAAHVLETWDYRRREFVKILPLDYGRVLAERRELSYDDRQVFKEAVNG